MTLALALVGAGLTDVAGASRVHMTGPQQATWLDRLVREHDNPRGALGWAVGQSDAELSRRMAAMLSIFWFVDAGFARASRTALAGGVRCVQWRDQAAFFGPGQTVGCHAGNGAGGLSQVVADLAE